MNESEERCLDVLRNLQRAVAADCLHETSIQAGLVASFSPLRQGQIAARASRQLENRLFKRLVFKALAGDSPIVVPDYDPEDSVALAEVVGTQRKLRILDDSLTMHALWPGTTGSGKTTGLVVLTDGLVAKRIQVVIFARKEAGRLLMRYPTAILLRPQQLPINFASPIGDPRLFFAEWVPILLRGIGCRSDYVPKALDVVLRAHISEEAKGRRLSLARLEKIFSALGQQGDRRCVTIGSASASFNLFLSDTARIEEAPQWEDRFSVIILDREGAPPAYRACLDGMMQHRFQAQAAQDGYSHHLRRVLSYDEAGLELGREFEAQQAGAGFVSAAKRGISQLRSYGVGIIYAGQSYSLMSEDIKENTNLLSAFRTLSQDDIRELGARMQLTEEQKQRFPTLPPGRAFVAAPDLPRAVEVQFEHVDLGPYPAEDEIAARMCPVLRELQRSITYTAEERIQPLDVDELLGEEAPAPVSIKPPVEASKVNAALLEDHWAFLRDVVQHEDSGIAARLHRLGFGASKSSRIKDELIALGLLDVVEVRKSLVGAATKLLRLTDLARTLPGL